MPLTKLFVHLVWSTKNREPYFISKEIRSKVLWHIIDNAKGKGLHISSLNVCKDHVHCLLSLGSGHTISKVAQLLKGESSHWINANKLCGCKFEWQDEYFAGSVSEASFPIVKRYIENQEEHHRIKTFQEEYDELISKISPG